MKNKTDGKDRNREKIFKIVGRCKEHPDYQLLRKPVSECIHCNLLWRALGFLIGGKNV